MRLVSLLEIEKAPRKNEWRNVLTSGQWDQRYRALITWYFIRSQRRQIEQYRQWAVFTIVDDVPLRIAA